jgi:hypothetical protein
MSCRTGKRRFRDELAAKFALMKAGNSRQPRRRECRYYYCKFCEGYHLTSQIKLAD